MKTEETATLLVRLGEANAALHRLMTGTAEVQVQHDDMQVSYNQANADRLRSYVRELEEELVRRGAMASTSVTRRKPLYVQL
jgi:hypothetical protein